MRYGKVLEWNIALKMVKILEVEQWKQRKHLEVEKLRTHENFWSGTRA